MKRFLFLSIFAAAASVFGAGCSAYSSGADADMRAVRRRAGELQDSLNYVEALQALNGRKFVFEADMLVFKRGGTAHVMSNLNFVSLVDDKATVQVAPFDSGGPNGVGGVTVEGRVTNIEEKTDKRGNTRLTMSVMGRGVFAAVDITLTYGSNNGMVTINPNLNSNRITLYGKIVPIEKSRVFKGMSL